MDQEFVGLDSPVASLERVLGKKVTNNRTIERPGVCRVAFSITADNNVTVTVTDQAGRSNRGIVDTSSRYSSGYTSDSDGGNGNDYRTLSFQNNSSIFWTSLEPSVVSVEIANLRNELDPVRWTV